MGKQQFSAAAAFAKQSAEGTFDSALETAVAADSVATTHGLILGSPTAGINETGLDFEAGRVFQDKARVGGFTRPISDFLALTTNTFTFAAPFCGNREDVQATPVDTDFQAIPGMEALLAGAFMDGAGSGATWVYKVSAGTNPFCGYVWYNGTRVKFLDARCSISIGFTAQEVPVLTATIEAGQVFEDGDGGTAPSGQFGLPGTLDYGKQASVGAPNFVNSKVEWGPHTATDGGVSEATLALDASVGDVPDSNTITGVVKEPSDLAITLNATIYKVDTAAAFEFQELARKTTTDPSNLDPFEFNLPYDSTNDTTPASSPAKAVRVRIPQPELQGDGLNILGVQGAANVSILARGEAAGDELELIFR